MTAIYLESTKTFVPVNNANLNDANLIVEILQDDEEVELVSVLNEPMYVCDEIDFFNFREKECGICFDEILPDKICLLQCGHEFCCDCIYAWLSNANFSCPYCRSKVTFKFYAEYVLPHVYGYVPNIISEYLKNNNVR